MTTFKPAFWLLLSLFFLPGSITPTQAASQGFFNDLNEEQSQKVLKRLKSELLNLRTWDSGKRAADKKASKSLQELLAEQAKADSESKNRTSAGKALHLTKGYAVMASQYIAANMTDFSRVAGGLSAGDMKLARQKVPEWGAVAFGQLVSDTLDSNHYLHSKIMWDELIGNASSLKNVTIAFASGDTKKLSQVAWKEAEVAGKKYSKKVTVAALNWVFSDINSGWETLTGKLPLLKVTVGDAYVALVEAETEFIQVGKNYLKQRRAGKCLDLYVSEFDRLHGDRESAYNEFELCDFKTLGSSSYFRGVEAYITRAKKEPHAVYIAMLESYRKHRTSPDRWLQKRVQARKVKIKSQVNPGLKAAQLRIDTVSLGFMGALRIRLNQLAWEEMDRPVKDELEMRLAAALNKISPTMKTLRERQEKVIGRCNTYDKAMQDAEAVLAQSHGVNAKLRHLEAEISSLPSCDKPGRIMQQLPHLIERAESERQAFDKHINTMKQAVDQTCRHANAIKTSAHKGAAKEHVDQCQDTARQAEAAIGQAGRSLDALAKIRDAVAKIAQGAGEEKLPEALKNIGKLKQQLSELRISITKIEAAFNVAKQSMSKQPGPATAGAAWMETSAREINRLLQPFKAAPAAMKGAGKVQQILAITGNISDNAAILCSDRVDASWSGKKQPWRYRSIMILPPPDLLAGKIDAANQSCSQFASNKKPSDVVKQLNAWHSQAENQRSLFAIARKGYQQCVAKSLVSYKKYWLDPQPSNPVRGSEFQAGEWEFTTTIEMPGMPTAPPPMRFRQCLKNQNTPPQQNAGNSGCKMLERKISGNTLHWKGRCESRQGRSDIDARITYSGDRVTGVTHTTIKQGKYSMTMTGHMKGRRIGPCR